MTDHRLMKKVSDVIEAMGQSACLSNWHALSELANLTGLKRGRDGGFYVGNWWRGPLLYALVSYHRPRNILEIGTGRGYGALAVAKAVADGKLDATIWTVDITPPDVPMAWAIDEGKGPGVRFLSVNQVWETHVPATLRAPIRFLTGASHGVMRRWRQEGRPNIDLVFIDAAHDYWSVKHDFVAALEVANPAAVFLFDDYGNRRRYGVKRLIDEELAPKCPPGAVTIIDTGAEEARPDWERVEHKMVLLTTVGIDDLCTRFYSRAKAAAFMAAYSYVAWGRRASVAAWRAMRRAAGQ